MVKNNTPLKLSPSDFAYLYEDCKLCYCLKVKHGISQPSMPMPAVFSAINTRLQTPLVGKNLRELGDSLPEGVVVSQEGWVESVVIPGTNLFIKGKYDLLIKAANGEHILVDLKISQPNEDKIDKYQTQLGAYKFAMENPANRVATKISRVGLLVFYPDTVVLGENKAAVDFPATWLEVPVDAAKFLKFMTDVEKLLAGPMPAESPECKWCTYRHTGESLSHLK